MIKQTPDEHISVESLIGQIADEFAARVARGEAPQIAEYTSRYPECAKLIEQVLGSVEVMQSLALDPEIAGEMDAHSLVSRGQLGDFRIVREIGRSGMGIVYEAEQISLGRRVALKVLPFAAVLDERQLKRFKNEAQAAAGLDHPNIVGAFWVGCERGVHFYAMPYIEGESLAEVIASLRSDDQSGATADPSGSAVAVATSESSSSVVSGAIHEEADRVDTKPVAALSTERSTTSTAFFRSVARLGIQAAEALEHAHQSGVVHRDIKPSNLMVDAAGHLSITDFGLAMTQTGGNLTMTGDLLGTLRYMSPEQAAGNRVVLDHRTDIYSLGITLHELLTLRPAFPGNDRQKLIRDVADKEPRRPRQENPAIPRDLETIVLKATAKERDTRYRSAQELADDLVRFIEDKPIRAKRPGPLVRLQKWTRRHKALTATVAFVLILAAVVAGGIKRERDRQFRDIERSLGEALAAAYTAIEAKDYALAEDKLIEAEGRIAGTHSQLPSAARGIRALHEQLQTFQEFNRLADEAHVVMGGDLEPARRALAIYGVMERSDWLADLERGPLPAEMRNRIVRTAYEMLLLLADDQVRWPDRLRADGKQPAGRQGLAYIDKALTFHAPTRGLYWLRAKCRRLLGDSEAAEADAELTEKTVGTMALDHYLPGRDARWSGRYEEAIEQYQAALRLDRGHFVSLYFLGLALDRQGRYVEALMAYVGSVAARPAEQTSISVDVLRMLSRLGKHEETLSEFNAFLRGKPDMFALHNSAYFLANRPNPHPGDIALATKLARAGVEAFPRNPNLWSVLGQARYRGDDYLGAIEALAKSIELNYHRKARNWFFLAMAHRKLGNQPQARRFYDRAVNRNGSSPFRDEAAELLGIPTVAPKPDSKEETDTN